MSAPDVTQILQAIDADRAMQWLHKAVRAGYKDTARLEKDTDLDALREREDFKALLASLTPKEPAPPPQE